MAPMAALEANPVPNAVAVVSLEEASKTGGKVTLPAGAVRLAVSIKVNSRLRLLNSTLHYHSLSCILVLSYSSIIPTAVFMAP